VAGPRHRDRHAEVTRAIAHELPVCMAMRHRPGHIPRAFDYVSSAHAPGGGATAECCGNAAHRRAGDRQFPEFGHVQLRWQLFWLGACDESVWAAPGTRRRTSPAHPDFFVLCGEEGYRVEKWLAVEIRTAIAWRRLSACQLLANRRCSVAQDLTGFPARQTTRRSAGRGGTPRKIALHATAFRTKSTLCGRTCRTDTFNGSRPVASTSTHSASRACPLPFANRRCSGPRAAANPGSTAMPDPRLG